MHPVDTSWTASLIVVSNRVAGGTKPNHAGEIAAEMLNDANIEAVHREVINESEAVISSALDARLERGDDLIITIGGTGIREGNFVPEVTSSRIAARLYGLETQVLLKGLHSSPKAGLCRGVIGVSQLGHPTSLIINSAGSRGAVKDTLSVVLPLVPDILGRC